MELRGLSGALKITICSFFVASCQSSNFTFENSNPLSFVKDSKIINFVGGNNKVKQAKTPTKPLSDILRHALVERNDGTDFITVLSSALEKDPVLISQKQIYESKVSAIASSEARKEYQVTSTIYGGVEDITDNTKGLALGLNASRLVFDGGQLNAEIASKTFQAEMAKLDLQAATDSRAFALGEIWLELEKYQELQKQIDERLAVLDPLIGQLEQVAQAGIGDVSKVTAAQRTVSGIRVTQTNISEGLAKAQLEFANAYGSVQETISYDPEIVRDLIPDTFSDELAKKSPLLLAKYANYKAALENLKIVEAKNEFNIGLEARAMMPFAGSGYDSDESIGLVARKTLFNGGMRESEIDEAEAVANSALAEVESAYRQGVRAINSAQQSIESMDKAIVLARENAKVTSDEIAYLRQQLIIGGSTLDSVLSAEARLYEAESKEINFRTNKRLAELLIVSSLGLLSSAVNIGLDK
ncbi:TolC family protein [Paracoccaceae bacterium]|nr:TolC family protein [Paracoccaceae bacterium]